MKVYVASQWFYNDHDASSDVRLGVYESLKKALAACEGQFHFLRGAEEKWPPMVLEEGEKPRWVNKTATGTMSEGGYAFSEGFLVEEEEVL